MSLLKQNTIKKKQLNIAIKLDKGNSKEYKVEVIYNNKVYVKKLDNGHHLPGFYYLV